ncbi:hypothetical protein PLIIFM63780_010556 [Purpureocillium lilacinum]|nr:hypothetical protein PLIIFM63780_010556 [Purpureocillium lilacinum]
MAKRDGDIEIHQIYKAPIGVDTNYLTMQGSSTKWIGVNKDYLTESTSIATVNNVKTTTVVKAQLSVVTAIAASDGVDVGDVTVLMADSIREELAALIKGAAASCGAPAKKSKRDGMGCMINAFQGAAQDDRALALVNPAEWNGFALELADSAPQIMAAAVQVLKTQAQKNRFAIMVAAAAVAGLWTDVTRPVAEAAHKYVFDGGQFGSSKEHPDGKTATLKTTATSTASCNPSATVNENSPACDDPDCKGKGKVCKADGNKKNCPCVMWVDRMIEGHFDKDWADAQQKILKELDGRVPKVVPPQCFRNTYGDGFDGKPNAEPSAFCHCSSAKSDGGMTRGNYPTMSGQGDKACTYSTMPTQTISIIMKSKQTRVAVTSCRMESSYSLTPYCTCNDGKMHGQIATTYGGKVTTVCPDATATMTSSQVATQTLEPSCYPTHGPPHNNPANDELIRLCRTGKDDFARVCKSETRSKVHVACPGPPGPYKGPWRPIDNNKFWAWFEEADNAPEECKLLFKQGGSGNPDEVASRVNALCVPAFEAIQRKCT